MMISKRTKFNEKIDSFKEKSFPHFLNRDEVLNLFSNLNVRITASEKADRGNFISQFIILGEKK